MGEKKKSKLGVPNTFKTQVWLNTLLIPLCLFPLLGGHSQSCLSPSIMGSSCTNPSPWLLLLLLCEHQSLESGWGCRAGLCCAPSSCWTQLSLVVGAEPSPPHPWPGTASLSRDRGTAPGPQRCFKHCPAPLPHPSDTLSPVSRAGNRSQAAQPTNTPRFFFISAIASLQSPNAHT